MSYAVQTPQRPLPGAYLQTPAVAKPQNENGRTPFPNANTTLLQQRVGLQGSQQVMRPPESQRQSAAESHGPITRASRTINEVLVQESRYPELDGYLGHGVSSDYNVSTQPAWAPFQKDKVYPIPDRILDQCNRAQVAMKMGLFAELNHAWVAIDNAVYLWDYTHPDPELVGFEEQPNTITAIRLTVPRAGVFVSSITHLLVVATTADLILVGLSTLTAQGGGKSVSLYQTRLSIPVRGMGVNIIEGSRSTGRIFFSGRQDEDVYELTYQQEEKWFQSRCAKINHTSKGLSALAPTFGFGQKPQEEIIVQMAVDDSRRLLWTLSSKSRIKAFHMKTSTSIDLTINNSLRDTFIGTAQMTTFQTDLITQSTQIVAIHPISANEASKMHLMATTSTGCRLFMSATSSSGAAIVDPSNAPNGMRVVHAKYPPSDVSTGQSSQRNISTQMTSYGSDSGINTSSKALIETRLAARYSPGYFFCFVRKDPQASTDALFVSAPDTGRIAQPGDPSRQPKYFELGCWLNLGGSTEDIQLCSAPFFAATSPNGFANELAVQFDKPAAEVAILTNTGIHTLRRRRLVDMFAAAIRYGGGDEGLEADVRRFIGQYGRGETASTALAVACGQGLDVSSDSRAAKVSDPEVLEFARKAFIDYGGRAIMEDHAVVDQALPAIDTVKPSPRHQGLSLYVARLIRSIWTQPVINELISPQGFSVSPGVSLQKLRDVQQDLSKLQEFLSKNKSFIDGLSGPEALGNVSTKQEEVTLQAEHRALHAMVLLIANIIEGISFVLVLFDERVEDIVLSLPNDSRQQLRLLSYERLFSTDYGRELAKELVKAIVNRNIANGSNVETIAEALRRKCGSFCSADDVVIFKAQEQLKKAAEAGSSSEFGRNLLNESLRLFKQVAGNLSMEQLHWAIQQYMSMQFYAGAIQLALDVAQEKDRGNRALTWIQDGRPAQDSREAVFDLRRRCYDLIHQVIVSLDQVSSQKPEMVDGQYTLTAKRRAEAQDVIDTSEDEVFQTNLYDWYLSHGQAERLLEIQSPYVPTYLQRKSNEDIAHADLLWKYYCQADRFHDAAEVQYKLARSDFPLKLDRRIEYLSRAKANASTFSAGIGRQKRQVLLREISDLLDIANIQDDVLQRLKGDERITPDKKAEIPDQVDGKVLGISDLYNGFADPGEYHDICILIYQSADHRNPIDIRITWQRLLQTTHDAVIRANSAQPYEVISEKIRSLGSRLNLSDTTFPIPDLLPMLERYSFDYQRGVGPTSWVVDTFLDVGVPYEVLFAVLEGMFYNDEAPFQGKNRKYIANDMLYVAERWFRESSRGNVGKVLAGESNAMAVLQTLQMLQVNGLDGKELEECQTLCMRIDQIFR